MLLCSPDNQDKAECRPLLLYAVSKLSETGSHHKKIPGQVLKITDERGRIPVAYLLYGVFFFCLLIAIFFPYKRLAQRLIGRFGQRSGIQVNYQDFAYAFPAGCAFEGVEIFLPSSAGRIRAYKGSHLTLRFSLLSLLKRDLRLRFDGDAYGGETAGEAVLPLPVRREAGTYQLQVKDLRYEEIVAPFYLRDFKISGSLTGTLDLHVQGRDYAADWTGTLRAALNQGKIRNLFIKDMPLPDFAFEEIEVKADLAKGNLHLEGCRVKSEVFFGEIRGEIALDSRDIRDSRLNLSARLKPAPEDPVNLHGVATFFNKAPDAEGYYPFRLQGTFRFPELE